MREKSYVGWIGSEQFDSKANSAAEAKRNIAWQYRNRHQAWDSRINDIIDMIELQRIA